MAKVSITTEYTLSIDTVIDLPEGKTWDDVEYWYVKWGRLFLSFKDGTSKEVETNFAEVDSIDYKRPDRTAVRPVGEDGYADWSVEALDEV